MNQRQRKFNQGGEKSRQNGGQRAGSRSPNKKQGGKIKVKGRVKEKEKGNNSDRWNFGAGNEKNQEKVKKTESPNSNNLGSKRPGDGVIKSKQISTQYSAQEIPRKSGLAAKKNQKSSKNGKNLTHTQNEQQSSARELNNSFENNDETDKKNPSVIRIDEWPSNLRKVADNVAKNLQKSTTQPVSSPYITQKKSTSIHEFHDNLNPNSQKDEVVDRYSSRLSSNSRRMRAKNRFKTMNHLEQSPSQETPRRQMKDRDSDLISQLSHLDQLQQEGGMNFVSRPRSQIAAFRSEHRSYFKSTKSHRRAKICTRKRNPADELSEQYNDLDRTKQELLPNSNRKGGIEGSFAQDAVGTGEPPTTASEDPGKPEKKSWGVGLGFQLFGEQESKICLESKWFRYLLGACMLITIFGIDAQLVFLPKSLDGYFDAVLIFSIGFFLSEILLRICFHKLSYFCSFIIFWDLFAALSIIADLRIVLDGFLSEYKVENTSNWSLADLKNYAHLVSYGGKVSRLIRIARYKTLSKKVGEGIKLVREEGYHDDKDMRMLGEDFGYENEQEETQQIAKFCKKVSVYVRCCCFVTFCCLCHICKRYFSSNESKRPNRFRHRMFHRGSNKGGGVHPLEAAGGESEWGSSQAQKRIRKRKVNSLADPRNQRPSVLGDLSNQQENGENAPKKASEAADIEVDKGGIDPMGISFADRKTRKNLNLIKGRLSKLLVEDILKRKEWASSYVSSGNEELDQVVEAEDEEAEGPAMLKSSPNSSRLRNRAGEQYFTFSKNVLQKSTNLESQARVGWGEGGERTPRRIGGLDGSNQLKNQNLNRLKSTSVEVKTIPKININGQEESFMGNNTFPADHTPERISKTEENSQVKKMMISTKRPPKHHTIAPTGPLMPQATRLTKKFKREKHKNQMFIKMPKKSKAGITWSGRTHCNLITIFIINYSILNFLSSFNDYFITSSLTGLTNDAKSLGLVYESNLRTGNLDLTRRMVRELERKLEDDKDYFLAELTFSDGFFTTQNDFDDLANFREIDKTIATYQSSSGGLEPQNDQNFEIKIVVVKKNLVWVAALLRLGNLIFTGTLIYITSKSIRNDSNRFIMVPLNKIALILNSLVQDPLNPNINVLYHNESIADGFEMSFQDVEYRIVALAVMRLFWFVSACFGPETSTFAIYSKVYDAIESDRRPYCAYICVFEIFDLFPEIDQNDDKMDCREAVKYINGVFDIVYRTTDRFLGTSSYITGRSKFLLIWKLKSKDRHINFHKNHFCKNSAQRATLAVTSILKTMAKIDHFQKKSVARAIKISRLMKAKRKMSTVMTVTRLRQLQKGAQNASKGHQLEEPSPKMEVKIRKLSNASGSRFSKHSSGNDLIKEFDSICNPKDKNGSSQKSSKIRESTQKSGKKDEEDGKKSINISAFAGAVAGLLKNASKFQKLKSPKNAKHLSANIRSSMKSSIPSKASTRRLSMLDKLQETIKVDKELKRKVFVLLHCGEVYESLTGTDSKLDITSYGEGVSQTTFLHDLSKEYKSAFILTGKVFAIIPECMRFESRLIDTVKFQRNLKPMDLYCLDVSNAKLGSSKPKQTERGADRPGSLLQTCSIDGITSSRLAVAGSHIEGVESPRPGSGLISIQVGESGEHGDQISGFEEAKPQDQAKMLRAKNSGVLKLRPRSYSKEAIESHRSGVNPRLRPSLDEMTVYEKRMVHSALKDRILVKLEQGAKNSFFLEDEIIKKMFRRNLEFRRYFRNAVNFYKLGAWDSAIEAFEVCLRMKPRDGPTLSVLRFMNKYGFEKPKNWRGYRRLSSKAV